VPRTRERRGAQPIVGVLVADALGQRRDVVDGAQRLEFFDLRADRIDDARRIAARAHEERERRCRVRDAARIVRGHGRLIEREFARVTGNTGNEQRNLGVWPNNRAESR
jgi:hypothetical protein